MIEKSPDGATHIPVELSANRLTDGLRDQLRQVVGIQHEMLRRLLEDSGDVPLELAEAFEDAGNRLLDLSEMISHRWRASTSRGG